MPMNIKFELLELLANDYPNWVNVRPLINKHRFENNFTRQDFSTLLYSLQDKKFKELKMSLLFHIISKTFMTTKSILLPN